MPDHHEEAFFAKKSVMLDVCPPFCFWQPSVAVSKSANECPRLRAKDVYSQWVMILLSSETHYLVEASSLGSFAPSSPRNLPAPKLYACLRAWWGIQKRTGTFQEILTEVESLVVLAPRPVPIAWMVKVTHSVVLRTLLEFHLSALLSVG